MYIACIDPTTAFSFFNFNLTRIGSSSQEFHFLLEGIPPVMTSYKEDLGNHESEHLSNISFPLWRRNIYLFALFSIINVLIMVI